MELNVKEEKEIENTKKNANRGDFFWFFIFVVLPFISLMYSIGEFLYENRIGV